MVVSKDSSLSCSFYMLELFKLRFQVHTWILVLHNDKLIATLRLSSYLSRSIIWEMHKCWGPKLTFIGVLACRVLELGPRPREGYQRRHDIRGLAGDCNLKAFCENWGFHCWNVCSHWIWTHWSRCRRRWWITYEPHQHNFVTIWSVEHSAPKLSQQVEVRETYQVNWYDLSRDCFVIKLPRLSQVHVRCQPFQILEDQTRTLITPESGLCSQLQIPPHDHQGLILQSNFSCLNMRTCTSKTGLSNRAHKGHLKCLASSGSILMHHALSSLTRVRRTGINQLGIQR